MDAYCLVCLLLHLSLEFIKTQNNENFIHLELFINIQNIINVEWFAKDSQFDISYVTSPSSAKGSQSLSCLLLFIKVAAL